jgi:hypothetical protein
MSDFLQRARELADQHDNVVDETIEKAGDLLDERTGGKFSGQLDNIVDEAQKRTGDGDTAN